MGLLTTLRKQKLKDKEIRLLMLGLDNAGKTTIVKKLMGEDVMTVSPTLGFNICTVPWNGLQVNIWDVGGQNSLRPFWRNYFEKTDALIWVVDASSLDRLDECKVELNKVIDEDRLTGATLLIFINKIDTIQDSSEQEKIAFSVSKKLDIKNILNHNCKVLTCSAYTGLHLNEGMDWITADVKDRLCLFD
ncbi:ADP-ribosylation factor family-domain-containing protein [Dipodascopsis uninucleata]